MDTTSSDSRTKHPKATNEKIKDKLEIFWSWGDKVITLGEDGDLYLISKEDAASQEEALLIFLAYWIGCEGFNAYIEWMPKLEEISLEKWSKEAGEEWYYIKKESGYEYWTYRV